MSCVICKHVESARASANAAVIGELSETYAALFEMQGCPGWVVLWLKDHHEHMELLDAARQASIHRDVAAMAGAMRRVLSPRRINYACLCNQAPHVHWHLIPRMEDDPSPLSAVWSWSPEVMRGTMDDAGRAAMVRRLSDALKEEIR